MANSPSPPAVPDPAFIDHWVDAHHDAQVAFLRAVVGLPTDMPPGDNDPAAQGTAELLAALGFVVERHAVPNAIVAANGMLSATNLIVRERFGSGRGPTIALAAHGDVVPPGAGWTRPPYQGVVEDGRMYGRGVAVSKSDIATYAFALAALRQCAAQGAQLDGSVELHFTYDEEFGGNTGVGWLLENALSKPDLAIAAGFSYQIVTAHNGCLQLEVSVRGRSAHGAMPQLGADALRAAVAILDALYGLVPGFAAQVSQFPGIESPTMIVGTIAGGTNTNVVPDLVSFRLDRRLIPEEDPVLVETGLRRVIDAAVADQPGISVATRSLLRAAALRPLPGHERLVAALQRHGERIFGEPIPAAGVPLYTDARHYAAHGCPVVVYGAGPRTLAEANAKSADENLLLEDLRRATKVVAAAVAELLRA